MKKIIRAISVLLLGTTILSGCADKPPRQILSSDVSRPIRVEENSAEDSAGSTVSSVDNSNFLLIKKMMIHRPRIINGY